MISADRHRGAGRSTLRVVTSHPGKQVIVYNIASQLARRGYLVAHLAAVYYIPDRIPYRLAQYVPGEAGERLRGQLLKRRCATVPDQLVVSWPWIELGTRALGELPGLRSALAQGRTYRAANAAHDRLAANWLKRRDDIDIVMAFQGSALRTLQAARKIGARAVLVATHPLSHERIVAAEYAKFGQRAPLPLREHLLSEVRAADCLLTASTATTDGLLESGVSEDRIKELPYGIDVPASTTIPVRAVRAEVRFLFVGKLSLHKGLHVLRQAWSSIVLPNVRLTLVGRPVGDVEAKILREWKDDRVTVVDEVPDINAAYRDADVFVFPSLIEGFGMVTLEAMAAGLPVIVTERSRGVVRHGVDGFVVRPGDAEDLARRMIQLAEEPRLRAELSSRASECAKQYTWDRFGSKLCDWLDDLVPSSERPRRSGATTMKLEGLGDGR